MFLPFCYFFSPVCARSSAICAALKRLNSVWAVLRAAAFHAFIGLFQLPVFQQSVSPSSCLRSKFSNSRTGIGLEKRKP